LISFREMFELESIRTLSFSEARHLLACLHFYLAMGVPCFSCVR
jgi:hypothetical protein